MSEFEYIVHGFHVILEPINIIFCFVGVLVGTLVGVLPGIGPVGAVALLLPITYKLSAVPAMIMLAGILYGAMYGGSTTSILVNIPGEAASVVTCIDGYQMARKGKAGPALGISAIGSFIAGTMSIIFLMILVPVLAKIALKAGAPDYFAIMLIGLVILTVLARGSMLKALMMVSIGLMLSQIGMDPVNGNFRFTFGMLRLMDGLPLVPVLMGLFGVSEILLNLEKQTKLEVIKTNIRELLPNLEEWKRSIGPILRGTFIGFFLGLVPGPAGIISSIMSYAAEKKLSKSPEKFGTGMIEGVAGPESANNAAGTGQFVPLLTLGIPQNGFMALIFAALLIQGIQPSPFLISEQPDIFWGVICSMYMGNIMLVILNLPLIGIWVQVLRLPYKVLFPLILLFCLIGSYSVSYSTFEIFLMIFFGIIGYLCRKLMLDSVPLVMAFVLGQRIEKAFRQSLAISHGSFLIFLERPISAICLCIALVVLITSFLSSKKTKLSLLDED